MNKYINLASRYTYVYIAYKSLRLSAQLSSTGIFEERRRRRSRRKKDSTN